MWAPKSQHFSKGTPVGYLPSTLSTPLLSLAPGLSPTPFSSLWPSSGGSGSDPTIPPRMGPPECPLSALHDNTGCAQTEPVGRLKVLQPFPRRRPLKLCLLLPLLIDEISPILRDTAQYLLTQEGPRNSSEPRGPTELSNHPRPLKTSLICEDRTPSNSKVKLPKL